MPKLPLPLKLPQFCSLASHIAPISFPAPAPEQNNNAHSPNQIYLPTTHLPAHHPRLPQKNKPTHVSKSISLYRHDLFPPRSLLFFYIIVSRCSTFIGLAALDIRFTLLITIFLIPGLGIFRSIKTLYNGSYLSNKRNNRHLAALV